MTDLSESSVWENNITQIDKGEKLSGGTNGTLWSWGFNSNGQLGLGDTTNRSSPCQVGNLDIWEIFECDNHSLITQLN